uniref:Tetratricopeptide repeat protein n=1 Tax=Tolypothrix bouteillei VB521301 TaxID=1479485 RepID=A0A0C1NCY9_9CYAN
MSLSTRAAATAAPPARVEDLLSRLKSGERKPELLCAIGQSYFEKQQFDLAANAYREALDLDPAHGTARLNLAVCLEKLNRWADAAEQFEKALQIDSTREEAHLGLGICYLHLDRPRQALEIFERVLEKDEADQVALVGKAVALQLMEQAEEANLLYQRIFEDPAETREAAVELQADRQPHKIRDNVVVINAEYQRLETLVMSSIAEARFEDAVGHCRRLTELSPEHFAAWFNLGLAQQQLGHTEEARDAYRKAGRRQMPPQPINPPSPLPEPKEKQGGLDIPDFLKARRPPRNN